MPVCYKEVIRAEQPALPLNFAMLGFCVSEFGGKGARKRKKVVLKTWVLERQVTYFSLFPKWLKELCSSSTTLFLYVHLGRILNPVTFLTVTLMWFRPDV